MCATSAIMPVQAAEPSDFADDNVLVLSAECGNVYPDTLSIAACNENKLQKADRWLAAIIASYARFNAAMVQELQQEGNQNPTNPQISLEQSQADFERLRASSGDLIKNTGYPSSGSPLFAQQAMFRLTIERAQFLLRACDSHKGRELQDRVDLTVTDWCGR